MTSPSNAALRRDAPSSLAAQKLAKKGLAKAIFGGKKAPWSKGK